MTKLRVYLDNNQLTSYIVIGAVAALAVYFLVNRLMKDPYAGPSKAYYYNLATQEIVVKSSKFVPPIDLGNGEQGVLAHMYGCGSCPEAVSELKVGYLEKRSDAAKKLLEKYPKRGSVPSEEVGPLMRPDYQLIATTEQAVAGDWLPYGNSNGLSMSIVGLCENGEPKVICVP